MATLINDNNNPLPENDGNNDYVGRFISIDSSCSKEEAKGFIWSMYGINPALSMDREEDKKDDKS